MVMGGLAAMAAYWMHAARVERALFSLKLFEIPTFSVGIVGNLFSRLGSGAMPFLTPLFLQVGLGYSPSAAGLTMVPIVLGAMMIKFLAVPMIERFGYRRVLSSNTLLLGVLDRRPSALIDAARRRTCSILASTWRLLRPHATRCSSPSMNTLTLGDAG